MHPFLQFLLRPRFENLLRIDPESKPAVYLQTFDGADIQNLNYWLELFLSAGIATLGLVLNSPAVVIGAMLVSPLMGPIIALGLALAAADLYLGIKSALQLLLSIVGSILFAAMIVWALPLDQPTSEILARTRPNLLDLGVALFSGLAGSLLVSRSQSKSGGGVSALPGVAIAVALMPPLCAVGFGVGAGFESYIMTGAGLLFLTNLAAIVASAFIVFFLLRMDSVDVRLAIAQPLLERASKDSIYHYLESRTAISRSFGNIGKLRWRITMVALAIGLVLPPLSNSLTQLRDELIARDAVERAIQTVAPTREDVIVRDADILSSETITVRLVVASAVDEEARRQAERQIVQRTGRDARVIVRRVANEEEIAQLRQGMRTQTAPTPANLATIQADLLARLYRPLNELWPEKRACLQSYEIAFSPDAVVVRIAYQADENLDETARDILTRGLRSALGVERVRLSLENETPPPQESRRR
jgi:uncharacterized hydrophobic protein (TIGR00271 family)